MFSAKRRIPALITCLVLGIASLVSPKLPAPAASSCDRDFTLRLAPYDRYQFDFCSEGDPILKADCVSGADVDAYLYDSDYDLVGEDELLDGWPRVSADAYGWNLWRGVIRNCTGRWQTVHVRTR